MLCHTSLIPDTYAAGSAILLWPDDAFGGKEQSFPGSYVPKLDIRELAKGSGMCPTSCSSADLSLDSLEKCTVA